ncbi:MAG: hypothetical protein HQL66_06260 [Magnetococcales bacterium]|nr:hypothetical protein [Magnetococcales bacterium]
MIFLLPVWLGASMGLGLGMLAFHSRHPARPLPPAVHPDDLSPDDAHALISCEIITAEEEAEEQLLLAVEEIPLDNRHGAHSIVSEHEFTRTAKVAIEVMRDHKADAELRADLWKLIQAKAALALSRRWGVEVGGEIQRKIRLRFTVDPGKMVRHQVTWKQSTRRGAFTVRHPNGSVRIPFVMTYGLFHEVTARVVTPPETGIPAVSPPPATTEGVTPPA